MATTTASVLAGSSQGAYQGLLVASTIIAANGTNTVTLTGINTQRSLAVVFNVTSFTAGTVTVTLAYVLPSGTIQPVLPASSAVGSAVITTIQIGPGLLTTANASFDGVVAPTMQVIFTFGGSASMTYQADYILGY